ncbi:MAG TPA: DUF423 domain-containing protein [Planctomycetota bacterium]|nr:DUF423 domain-containing protein [Planctomycetota bacterium]
MTSGFERAERTFIIAGAAGAFLGVAGGAFGAHVLRRWIPGDRLEFFEVGVRYQLLHSLALFAVAWVVSRSPSRSANAAGWLFVAGIVLFSGSLYAFAGTGVKTFGALTPLGGLALLSGWALLGFSAARSGSDPRGDGRPRSPVSSPR